MNDEDLVKLEQNAFRDSMKDGVTEALAGLMFLYMGIIFFNPSFVGIFVIFYIILFPRLVEEYRQRYTYPRIGYVKLKTSESKVSFTPFIILLAAATILTGIATHLFTGDSFNLYNWLMLIPFAVGLMMFGPSIYLVEKTGSRIYWLFGGFTSILGLGISYLSVLYSLHEYLDGALIFCLILGLILMFGGLLKMAYFRRRYPVIEQQEDVAGE